MVNSHRSTPAFISLRLIQRFTTSNPSTAYLYRVASAFRESEGGMTETLKAILLDYEVRELSRVTDDTTFGLKKAPLDLYLQLLQQLLAAIFTPLGLNPIEDTVIGRRGSARVRALVPDSDIGSQWRTDSDFSDATWLSGRNGIGYERQDEGRLCALHQYRRRRTNGSNALPVMSVSSSMSTAADLDRLELHEAAGKRCDDGFVAYLNGSTNRRRPCSRRFKLGLLQPPRQPMTPSRVTLQDFPANSFLNLLQPGENLLAIHALNASSTSSDFLNQVKLIAGFNEGSSPYTEGMYSNLPLSADNPLPNTNAIAPPADGYLANFGYPTSQLSNFTINSRFRYPVTDQTLSMTPFSQETVFNYYLPFYSPGDR